MNIPIKPQEYYYLDSPLSSDPIEMLKYTFQGLVVDSHITACYKFLLINKNEKYKRKRIFIKLGDQYNKNNSYSKAEQFVISLFKDQEELRLYEIKKLILDSLDDDIANFKSKYVYEDVKRLGLCSFKYLLNKKGSEAKNTYASLIEILDANIDDLLKTETILQIHLKELGTGIIFLEATTLDKLKLIVPNLDELASIFEIITDEMTYGGGGYSSYGGGGYSSGGGFGGFGGGSGGGAGSGGTW